jgi:hypothetical protein
MEMRSQLDAWLFTLQEMSSQYPLNRKVKRKFLSLADIELWPSSPETIILLNGLYWLVMYTNKGENVLITDLSGGTCEFVGGFCSTSFSRT